MSTKTDTPAKKPASTKELTASDYVHLHNHTHYSLLDGLQKVPEMLDRINELGMEAVAMTDHGTLSGTIEFYKTARDKGIKPIIGIETYVASRKHTDKDASKDKGRFHLILLAMNFKGYQNLMQLSTIANLDGFYHKPRIDHDLLQKYNEGLIVLSGCIGGEVGEAFRYNDDAKAYEIAKWYKSVFGDRYYLEVQDHGHLWDEQHKVNQKVLKMSEELDIPAVVTCDAHYCRHEDQEAHEILLCVQTGSFLSDTKRMSLKDTDLYVTDPLDVIKRWQDINPSVITNTKAIADRCHIELELGKILIPKFPVPEGENEKSYLHLLVYQGLVHRYKAVPIAETKNLTIDEAKAQLSEEVLKRTEYELNVIDNMGFNGYFLIIWDFVNWGKDRGIVFGPGRGSAAGAIVAYALKITDLDPLRYELLFERFLNPDRISMPDIDIDIQDTRRDEVIQYCVEKYGKDRVANIVTFGKMAARNAVRDVARVLQVPYAEADRMAKMIPPPVQGRHIPLAKSLVENSDLKTEYENNATSKQVFDLAVKVEGTIRSHGVHAAGVVIAPDDIVKFCPLEMAQKGVIATQYPMGPIEELGLLKMDFLGLSNLTIIKNALRIIKRVYDTDIDIATIPLDDSKTFELLQRGDTTGVFQLESSGMKRYLRDLKPTLFEDIVAMCALYRPGPLGAGLTDSFIRRKNGLEAVTYDHPTMESALKSTYGVLVYQEQVMQISKDMCGFTGGQADTLRKAIGKKIKEVMMKMEKDFVEGAINNSGVKREVVQKFWNHLLGFADYCFNKSHSACYGFIAYQTAYLKAHYPSAFMAALMTADYDDIDRLAIDITECKHLGIEVLQPDVNYSFAEFSVNKDKNQIRFGMNAIKNVGANAVEAIVNEREENGPYTSLIDFVKRVPARQVNRKVWESLIKSGALDEFGSRGALLHTLDSILAIGQKIQKELNSGQTDLFGGTVASSTTASITLIEPPNPPNLNVRLQWERELLGLYLSDHPLGNYYEYLKCHTVGVKSMHSGHHNHSATIGGLLVEIKEIMTKNGQKMAFAKIEDVDSEIEVIVFPNLYKETADKWQRDNVVMITGKLDFKDRSGNIQSEPKLIADTIEPIDDQAVANFKPNGERKLPEVIPEKKSRSSSYQSNAGARTPQFSKVTKSPPQPKLYVRVAKSDDLVALAEIKKVIDSHPGDSEVILVLGDDKNKQAIKLPSKISPTDQLVTSLSSIIGKQNAVIQ